MTKQELIFLKYFPHDRLLHYLSDPKQYKQIIPKEICELISTASDELLKELFIKMYGVTRPLYYDETEFKYKQLTPNDLGWIFGCNIPPIVTGITRWFSTRSGLTAIDKSGNGLDAQILPPVSKFDGVNGSILYYGTHSEIDIKITGVFNIINSMISTPLISRYCTATNDRVFSIAYYDNKIAVAISTDGITGALVMTESVNVGANFKLFFTYKNDIVTLRLESLVNSNINEFTETFIGPLYASVTPLNIMARDGGNSNFAEGTVSDFTYDEILIPLPHTGHGIDPSKLVGQQNVDLTVSGGVTEGFDENGSTWLLDYGYSVLNDEIYPHASDGTATISNPDKDVAGNLYKLNDSSYKLRLYEAGDTEFAKTFFDKSNIDIYEQTVRDSIHYDSADTGLFDQSELTQAWGYTHVKPAYKYQWWIRIKDNQYEDMFLYEVPLTDDIEICKTKTYVDVGEVYPEDYVIPEGVNLCDIDSYI